MAAAVAALQVPSSARADTETEAAAVEQREEVDTTITDSVYLDIGVIAMHS